MKTLHHKIGAFDIRIPGKIRMKAKMCSVGLVHDQRDPLCVGLLPDLLHIGDDPLVGGRNDHHRADRRIRFQGPSHIFRRDLRIQPGLLIKSRIQIDRSQLLHIDRVIHGLVAISCHKYGIASSGHSGEGA